MSNFKIIALPCEDHWMLMISSWVLANPGWLMLALSLAFCCCSHSSDYLLFSPSLLEIQSILWPNKVLYAKLRWQQNMAEDGKNFLEDAEHHKPSFSFNLIYCCASSHIAHAYQQVLLSCLFLAALNSKKRAQQAASTGVLVHYKALPFAVLQKLK